MVLIRKRKGLRLSRTKKSTYLKKRGIPCSSPAISPFPKKIKFTSTPMKVFAADISSPKSSSARKQLFQPQNIGDMTKSFQEMDISSDSTFLYLENLDLPVNNDSVDQLLSIIPVVEEKLKQAGKGDVLSNFLKLVYEDEFPLNNIAFTLFCDLVKWFTLQDTRQMRYSPETMQFFWVGRRLFGGRFVRFMSGMKNETQQLRGLNQFDPQDSKINFACPHERLLDSYDPFNGVLPTTCKPGFLHSMIELKATRDINKEENKSYVLMFDGKKIKRGSDVNLLGFEKDKSLEEKQKERDRGLELVDKCNEIIASIQRVVTEVAETPEIYKKKVHDCLLKLLMLFSETIKDLRQMKLKTSKSLAKLKEKCGSVDWRESKYAYAIDVNRTCIWKLDNTIDKALVVQRSICEAGAYLNGKGSDFAKSDSVNLLQQKNVHLLKNPDSLRKEMLTNTSLVKQRSERWFNERKKVKVTGSTLFGALGCETLKKQRNHFDQVISGGAQPQPSQEQRLAMAHGTESEVHEIATLSSIIMPFLYPNLVFYEEGFYIKDNILVSPDGSLRNVENTYTDYAFEGKAPVGNPFCTPVHYKVPGRYIPQTLFEQRSVSARSGTLYMSWSKKSCTLFKVLPNADVCTEILKEVNSVYHSDIQRRPSRISDSAKQIKNKLTELSEACVFLGEFPSVCGYVPDSNLNDDNSAYLKHAESSPQAVELTYDEIRRHLILMKEVLKDAYELGRNIASQVIVYLLADLDRFWKEEEPHAIPVGYFYRGYSLSMDIMRDITEECKRLCRSRGLDVLVSAADGEFSTLLTRDQKGNPLTQLQLSKDVWKDVCHLSKSEIITLLKKETESHVATFEEKHDEENQKSTRVLNVHSKTGSLYRIKTPSNGWDKPKAKKKKSDEIQENESVLQDTEDSNLKDKPQNEFSQENSEENTVVERSMDNEDTLDYDYNECIGSETNSLSIKGELMNLIPGIKRALCAIKPKKWAQVQEHVLLGYFNTASTLQKFVMQELKEITMFTNLRIPNVKEKLTVRGLKKAAIVNQLARVLGDGSTIVEKERKRTVIKIEPLKILAQRAVMKKSYPKRVLNVSYCNFLWPEKKRQWLLKAHVSESITVHGVGELKSPFYVPNLTKDNDFEIGVYDKTHLGSNLRKTLSLDKLSGISKSAWTKVAEQNPDILNPTILEVNEEGKIIDQMKESLAKCLFTDVVEQKMLENGDEKEAKFCRIIREGLYTADDDPGIPATERCRKRLDLINWLQEGVDFGNFPPYGSRIKGMSYILYEGLRMSQESKLYLYALSKTGTYCVRSPNTLCSESFFSTMQEMDPWGQGVLSTDGVQKHISDFTAITALKMNENRSFYIRTKRDAAYPVHDIPEKPVQEDMTNDALTCQCRQKRFITCIIPRDHFFDTQLRARTSRPLKRFKFADVNDPCRGDLPVRSQYGYRLNEAKILPSKRLALNLDNQ